MSSSDGHDQPLCIDRFIILHLGLLPERGFDEASSIDELSEYILYFFDRQTTYQSNYDEYLAKYRDCRYNSEEALKFASLCQALYSLPSSMRYECNNNYDKERDFSKEVHLTTCTLVFIPLEKNWTEGLFAVAQYAKKQYDNTSEIGVNPNFVREYIHMCHNLFEIVKCGVHKCLLSFDWSFVPSHIVKEIFNGIGNVPTRFESNNSKPYTGMEELYQYYILLRNLTESRYTATCHESNIIETTKRIIEEIYNFLPITFVRNDLKSFYDWILAKWNASSNYHEQIKVHVLPSMKHQVLKKESEECQRLFDVIGSIPHLVGFSLFKNECHIHTEMKSYIRISPSQAHLIHKYLSKGSTIPKHNTSNQNGSYILPPLNQMLIRFGDVMILPNHEQIWFPRIFIHENIFTKTTMYSTEDTDVIIYINCLDYNSQDLNGATIITSLIQVKLFIDKEIDTSKLLPANNLPNDTGTSILHRHVHQGLRIMYVDKGNGFCIYLDGETSLHKINEKKNLFSLPFFKHEKEKSKSNGDQLHSSNKNIPKEFIALIQGHSEANEIFHHYSQKWVFSIHKKDKPIELYVSLDDEIFKSIDDALVKIDEICNDLCIVRTSMRHQ